MSTSQTDNSTDTAPAPTPFTLVGADDAGYCVDGVCIIPESPTVDTSEAN